LGGREAVAEILDRDVGVARDLATDQGLRGGIIGKIGIRKVSWIEPDELEGDIESGVGRKVLARLREQDDGGDHVTRIGDVAHDDAIAGASLDLQPVGQSLAGAEVDEVGRVPGTSQWTCETEGDVDGSRCGRGLASLDPAGIETILLTPRLDVCRVEQKDIGPRAAATGTQVRVRRSGRCGGGRDSGRDGISRHGGRRSRAAFISSMTASAGDREDRVQGTGTNGQGGQHLSVKHWNVNASLLLAKRKTGNAGE
jgi:hypothetical protein